MKAFSLAFGGEHWKTGWTTSEGIYISSLWIDESGWKSRPYVGFASSQTPSTIPLPRKLHHIPSERFSFGFKIITRPFASLSHHSPLLSVRPHRKIFLPHMRDEIWEKVHDIGLHRNMKMFDRGMWTKCVTLCMGFWVNFRNEALWMLCAKYEHCWLEILQQTSK